MRIRWSEPAVSDLEAIGDFIGKENSEAALRTVRRIGSEILTLRRFPRKGRPGRAEGTRELVLSGMPYLVVYELKNDVVVLLRILHGAMKWPSG